MDKNIPVVCHNVIQKQKKHANFGIPTEWHFSSTSHGKGACGDVIAFPIRESIGKLWAFQLVWGT
jgi:NifU-like protein involved in Fe-S cluster formation